MEAKRVQINIRADVHFKEMVEAYCQQHEITVSDFLRVAAMEAMRGKKIKERVRSVKIDLHKAKAEATAKLKELLGGDVEITD